MRTIVAKLRKPGERGQAIVLMALGFVALLAFVGIVTDISVLLVRYSTLRRAVDSASIAAATQMRQDRDVATVSLAARQFIQFHNLDPIRVEVQTCQTVPDVNSDGNRDEQDDPELCTADQRKLVRVVAQVESPTIFLRLFGWRTLTLEASAISETAVLDVVVIMDVSESMLNETTYEEWAEIGLGTVYVPPTWQNIMSAEGIGDAVAFWQSDLLGTPQGVINRQMIPGDTLFNPSYTYGSFVPQRFIDSYGAQAEPRELCRVRFWPFSLAISVPAYLRFDLYVDAANGTPWTGGSAWDGFVPNYDFYGCCNDPDGDGDFGDLICQPFRQARDATELFLERIDFLRGDRVAFVTFDRAAFIINPYDDPAQARGFNHMIDNFETARTTLRTYIGVRAEPNFYEWTAGDTAGGTGGLAEGWTNYARGVDNVGNSAVVNYDEMIRIDLNDYPVAGACPFQNASLPSLFSLYSTMNPGQPDDGRPAILDIMIPPYNDAGWRNFQSGIAGTGRGLDFGHSYELWASCRGTNIGAALREANNALLDPITTRRTGTVWVMVLLSDGAAGASDPVRRHGDVIAGGNPYVEVVNNPPTQRRYGSAGGYGAYGVCPYGTPSNPGELVDTQDDFNREGFIAFPFCSDELPETRHSCDFEPGRIDNNGDPGQSIQWNSDRGHVFDVDIEDFPTDCEFYDVDDYARDWADFVGLDDGTGQTQLPTIFTIGFGLDFPVASSGVPGTPGYVPGDCDQNVPDCLGEELLRYIADVGDNQAMDIDYQQDFLDNGVPNDLSLSEPGATFGLRSVCEGPGGGHVGGVYQNFYASQGANFIYDPLPPTQNCGNYFNAPGQQELQLVFDEIASRMFTRLAG